MDTRVTILQAITHAELPPRSREQVNKVDGHYLPKGLKNNHSHLTINTVQLNQTLQAHNKK